MVTAEDYNASDAWQWPAAGKDQVAECRLVKVGRVLVVGDVLVYSEGVKEPIALASGTYSVPPG